MKKYSRKHLEGVHPTSWGPGESSTDERVKPIIHPLLDWFPDELLFSLVARHHIYWGYRDGGDTMGVLFGTSSERELVPDLGEIEILVSRTGGRLGGPLQIFVDHTLFRFYQVFNTPEEIQRLFNRLRTAGYSHLKYPMGLWHGHFTDYHPLRACLSCIEEDIAKFGTPYWRLSHQYPGMQVCLKHRRALQLSAIPTSSRQKFKFYLPSLNTLQPKPTAIHRKSLKSFIQVSTLIENLVADRQRSVEALAELQVRFFSFIAERGLSTNDNRLRPLKMPQVEALCLAFIEAVQVLRNVPEFSLLPDSTWKAHYLLKRYMYGRVAYDPKIYFAMVFWFRSLPFWTIDDEKEWFT